MFKYKADMWWLKYAHTFNKWFEVITTPYAPLENYNRVEEHFSKSKEEGNKFDKFSNKDVVDNTHIGDSHSNQDYHNTYEDHDSYSEEVGNKKTGQMGNVEITDGNTTDRKTQATKDSATISNIKDGSQNDVGSETKDTNTTSKVNTDVFAANFNNEHSGGATGSFQNKAGDLSVTEQSDSRTTETQVSAYNEDSNPYSPSEKQIITGDMSNEGRNTSHTEVYGDGEDNLIAEVGANTKDTVYNELNNGTELRDGSLNEYNNGTNNQTVTTNEINSATDDTKKTFTDDKDGENSNNTKINKNEKYNENTIGKHTGDSQSIDSRNREEEISTWMHGQIGVLDTQTLIQKEVNISLFNIYDQIAELFVDDLCVRVYTNHLQRGGCYWC